MPKTIIADVEPFHAMAISRLAQRLRLEGRSVIRMEYGQPSTGAPATAIAAASAVLANDMGYWESQPLKARIARHYVDRHGLEVDPERIILTCGASPALVLALSSLFAPGARIAIARPGYVAYRNTLKTLYLEPIELDCGAASGWKLTAAALAAIDPPPDGVIIASPANPTGTITSPAELGAIAALCEARGIRIISDEIYHGLSFGAPCDTMLSHAPNALIINSFSKYFSMPGWRLGWLLVPPTEIAPAVARMSNMFLTPPSLAQHAGLAAFDGVAELEGHVMTYARNRDLLLAALRALGLGTIAPPDGAFYIYADIGHLTDDSLGFCMALLEATGVATAPGIDFDPVNGKSCMRFSFAVSAAEVKDAITRMIPWFEAQPKR